MSLIERLRNAVLRVRRVLDNAMNFLDKHGVETYDFVIDQAIYLEQVLPKNGFGSTRLAFFNRALREFLTMTGNDLEPESDEYVSAWFAAHEILEGYLEGQRMAKKAAEVAGE